MVSTNSTSNEAGPSSAGPSAQLQSITAALDRLTTHAASLPPKSDMSFHRTLDRKFAKSLDGTSEKLLSLTERLLTLVEGDLSKPRPGVKGKGRSKLADEQDAIEGFRRSVGNVIDGLLEDADSRLDEASGLKKAAAIQINPAMTAAASRKLPGPFASTAVGGNLGRLANEMMFADIPKPQLLFPDQINTANNQPWTPTLTEKPHSMVPLNYPISNIDLPPSPDPGADLKEWEIRKKKIKERNHPYWYETQHLPYPTRMFEVAPPIPPVELDECPLTFVDTPEALEEMVGYLKEAKEIAVDLEHHSNRSYYGFTCLMQISTRERDWVVDTLRLRGELREGKLGGVMVDPNIVKVFHGSDSDIIWLERDFEIYIVNLFDTYHATNVLNYPSHSLAYLLARFCSYTADKRYQMADWRIRPLPPAMIDYARSDTHYLLNIYDHLRNSLLEMSSRPSTPQPEILTTESTSLLDVPRQNPQAALRKTLELSAETALKLYEREEYRPDGYGVSGWRSLLRKSLPKDSEDTIEAAVLIALHKWRDGKAREMDESPFWIMPTDIIRQIGILRVPTRDSVGRLCRVKKMSAKDMVNEVLAVVQNARKEWNANPPAPTPKSAPVPSGQHTTFPSSDNGPSTSARSVVAAALAAQRAQADSLWEPLQGGSSNSTPVTVKPKSTSSLFGNTVSSKPNPPAKASTGKSKSSSMFGSTLKSPPNPKSKGKRQVSPTFDLISRRIAEGIYPAGPSKTSVDESVEMVDVDATQVGIMEPENVPFVPARQRTGFSALKEIAAKSRSKAAAGATQVTGAVIPDEAQGGPSNTSEQSPVETKVPVAKKSKDEIVKVKRQKKRAAEKPDSPAVASTSTSTPSTDITPSESTILPKKKKSKPITKDIKDIPVFDYTTEGNLLDQPNAAPRATGEVKSKAQKKKDKKMRKVDAPPPVMITTPDFGKLPRDMSQPKAGARSKTFTS